MIMKALVVDDSSFYVQLIGRVLKSEGMTVLVAYSGMEALKVLEKEKPDFILLDLLMPQMSGYDVLEMLKSKEETKSIPVIVLSANNSANREAIEMGAQGCLQKPIDDEALVQQLKEILHVKI